MDSIRSRSRKFNRNFNINIIINCFLILGYLCHLIDYFSNIHLFFDPNYIIILIFLLIVLSSFLYLNSLIRLFMLIKDGVPKLKNFYILLNSLNILSFLSNFLIFISWDITPFIRFLKFVSIAFGYLLVLSTLKKKK